MPPLAEDNEIGGIYNLVVGTYEEACDFLADTLKNLLEASVQLEYGELYHSFVSISADGSVASGMLRASYEDGDAYETVFSIANALGMDCYMSVKYDSDRETVVFNRQAMTYGMGGVMWTLLCLQEIVLTNMIRLQIFWILRAIWITRC